jgi:hypothetical protein
MTYEQNQRVDETRVSDCGPTKVFDGVAQLVNGLLTRDKESRYIIVQVE